MKAILNVWASLVVQMVKNLPAMLETWILIPGWGGSPGEGNGYPLQGSCLENSVDRGDWWATVHGVAKKPDLAIQQRSTFAGFSL